MVTFSLRVSQEITHFLASFLDSSYQLQFLQCRPSPRTTAAFPGTDPTLTLEWRWLEASIALFNNENKQANQNIFNY